jgi:hypothetical protein
LAATSLADELRLIRCLSYPKLQILVYKYL